MKKVTKKDKQENEILDFLLEKISPESQEVSDYRMLLASKIYNGIKAKGWTQTEFAKEMGKQNSIVSRWVSGNHNFEADTLFAIQRKLGINLLDLDNKFENNPVVTADSNSNLKFTINIFRSESDLSNVNASQSNLTIVEADSIQIIETSDIALN